MSKVATFDEPPTSTNISNSAQDGTTDKRLSDTDLYTLMTRYFQYENAVNLKSLSRKYATGWDEAWRMGSFSNPPAEFLTHTYLAYLDHARKRKIVLKKIEGKEDADDYLVLPYRYRGSKEYMGRSIHKFERLRKWAQDTDQMFIHITLSPQTTLFDSQVDCLFSMRDKRNTLLQYLRDKVDGKLEYIWVMEPTERGFPHFHLLVFAPWIPEIEDLAQWWEDNGLGEKQGVDWSKPYDPQRAGRIVGYLTKYLSKTFGKMAMGEDYAEGVDTGDGLTDFPKCPGGNKKLLLWSAILWITRSRSYSASEGISEVMNEDTEEGGEVNGLVEAEIKSRYEYIGALQESEIEVVEEDFGGDFLEYFNARCRRPPDSNDRWQDAI